jgi:predicted alpha/beta superfamily hydrolase
MKLLLLSLLLIFSFSVSAQGKIEIGHKDTVFSKILSENREVWIYLPRGYQDSAFGPAKYPVIYLLDGDAHFHSVTGMVSHLSEGMNGTTVMPPMIIVGILNTDRTRDLTPSHSTKMPGGEEAPFLASSGGGEKFASFIEKELMPFINSKYRTQPYNLLVGHSFGGITAVNFLLNHPKVFNSYIAIDPSMWWKDYDLLKQWPLKFSGLELAGNVKFYLSIANTLPPDYAWAGLEKDTSVQVIHIKSIHKLIWALDKTNRKDFTWGSQFYSDEDHGSVPFIAVYNGLRYIFKDYLMPGIHGKTVSEIEDYYKHYSIRWGQTVLPPAQTVNMIGWNKLQNGEVDKAIGFFELNVKNYPQAAASLFPLGEAYYTKGDKAKAKQYFDALLKLRPYDEELKRAIAEKNL